MLLLIIALAVVVIAIVLLRLSAQAVRTATEVERLARHLNYLQPRIERIVVEVETELKALHVLTEKVDQIAADVEGVSSQARRLVMPALSSVAAIAEPLRYASAALMGAKVGLQFLRSRRKRKTDDEDSE
jgi:predicted PurR-regulated permease PerM